MEIFRVLDSDCTMSRISFGKSENLSDPPSVFGCLRSNRNSSRSRELRSLSKLKYDIFLGILGNCGKLLKTRVMHR